MNTKKGVFFFFFAFFSFLGMIKIPAQSSGALVADGFLLFRVYGDSVVTEKRLYAQLSRERGCFIMLGFKSICVSQVGANVVDTKRALFPWHGRTV